MLADPCPFHRYVKFQTVEAAMKAHSIMHGRFFAKQQITADYIAAQNYHAQFPAAATATVPLQPPE